MRTIRHFTPEEAQGLERAVCTLTGHTVIGPVRLNREEIPFDLLFVDCDLGELEIRYAELRGLELRDCSVSRLDLTGTRVAGDLRLGLGLPGVDASGAGADRG